MTATLSKPALPTESPPYLNRDLSWLDFNARVLHEAEDLRTPLLDRVKFLAIFASNQDEFFMKRIGLLNRKLAQRSTERSLDGLTPDQQRTLIRQRLAELIARQIDIWQNQIRPALEGQGIFLRAYADLTPDQKAKADDYFQKQVFPVLTPLAVDPGHPFPFISNLSVSIGVLLRQPGQREHLFARVKVPQLFSRWLTFHEDKTVLYVPLESLIQGRLEVLFPGLEILEHKPFRITRNAEVETEIEDPEDLLEVVQEELRARRFADTVRVQIPPDMSAEMRQYLLDGLEISEADLYQTPDPLGMVDLMALYGADRPDLKLPPWKPISDPALADPSANIFAVIRQGDVLVHHPYESFDTSVERFILSAVDDPKVLAIKMTLYRTSGDSPFVPALARAAESGKQVAVLVELQARFDEERNIQWAQALENAGAHVVYGVLGLKTHTKTALIVRREDDAPPSRSAGGMAGGGDGAGAGGGGGGLRCYAHIATGNYNSKTAQVYTDLGLLTCREDICQDIVELFAFLTGRSLQREYRKLLVAPVSMRRRFLEMIEREIAWAKGGNDEAVRQLGSKAVRDEGGNEGAPISASAPLTASLPHCLTASPPSPPARIVAKMNALEDPEIIQALYRASQAGVQIDLIVRGFCCLRPGVPGLSENIRVTSIIGRFLEHSRIFYFQNGGQEEYFLGSADWMTRNLSHRVEAAVPVEDPALRASLREILDIMLADHRQAWDLSPDGTWTQRRPQPDEHGTECGQECGQERGKEGGKEGGGTHETLMALTLQRALNANLARAANLQP